MFNVGKYFHFTMILFLVLRKTTAMRVEREISSLLPMTHPIGDLTILHVTVLKHGEKKNKNNLLNSKKQNKN